MKIKFSVFIVAVLCATGCGASFWSTTNQNQNQTSVVLSENNFRVVKNVSAEVHCTYVFGIGGISSKALMSNAVSELTRKANLQGTQALINISVKTHNRYVLLWSRRSMIAHGTVIEFIDKNNPNTEELLNNTESITDLNNASDKDNLVFQGKSSYETKQMVRKYLNDIRKDIKNDDINSAKEKIEYLEKQCRQSDDILDSYIERDINQLKQELGL